MTSPRLFDVSLPDLPLERGGVVRAHRTRGFWWGPEDDVPALSERVSFLPKEALAAPMRIEPGRHTPAPFNTRARTPLPNVPTVLLVHALTGDARAGGDGGWWEPLVGPGRAFDPSTHRVLCFNNLGSNYGASNPLDAGWPTSAQLTTVDQARAVLLALDALGVGQLALVAGGSLGGMIALTLSALEPERVERLWPIAATADASAWLVGFNHVQRQVLRLDPARGLEVARQLAMLTYRAEPGLESTQGRTSQNRARSTTTFPVESYLEHQGSTLRERFAAAPYVSQLDAMDSHDLVVRRLVDRIRARTLVTDIDTDVLYTPARVAALADTLEAPVQRATLTSPHGHDAFLIEWNQLSALATRALQL